MAKYKVLLTDTIHEDVSIEREIIELNGGELMFQPDLDKLGLIEAIKEADAVINVFAKLDEEILDAAKKCKIIVRTGIGYNNIDIEYASKKGIKIANVPDYCFDEVADHTMALVLAITRKILLLNKNVQSGKWNINNAGYVPRLRGKTLGLIGFGNIARNVAVRAKSFGMEIVAFDPYASDDTFLAEGATRAESAHDIAKNSDIISLHAPVTPETENMINYEFISKMKRTAYIVNASRGQLIDEVGLEKALKESLIMGAGLDVLINEPPTFPIPLQQFDNVIITPHGAFYSDEAMPSLRRLSANEVVRVMGGNEPKNIVNQSLLSKYFIGGN